MRPKLPQKKTRGMISLKKRASTIRIHSFHPVHRERVQPEAGSVAGQKTQVPAVIRGNEPQVRILWYSRVTVDTERDQGIVLGVDQKSGYLDVFEELIGGLGPEIVGGRAEAE